jgi:hypothetical protein
VRSFTRQRNARDRYPEVDTSETLRKRRIQAAGAMAQATGVPGASTASDLVNFVFTDPDAIKAERKDMARAQAKERRTEKALAR